MPSSRILPLNCTLAQYWLRSVSMPSSSACSVRPPQWILVAADNVFGDLVVQLVGDEVAYAVEVALSLAPGRS